MCSLWPWRKILQSLSSTWGSWKSSCQAGGARAMGQRRLWSDGTTFAMSRCRTALSQFAFLLLNWQNPEPAHCQPQNLLWHRASLRKDSLSTPPAGPGRDQPKYQLSPATSPDFPFGIRLWESWALAVLVNVMIQLCRPGNCQMLRCHSRIFLLEASTRGLIWSKLYLSQDCLNRSKEDTKREFFFFT